MLIRKKKVLKITNYPQLINKNYEYGNSSNNKGYDVNGYFSVS